MLVKACKSTTSTNTDDINIIMVCILQITAVCSWRYLAVFYTVLRASQKNINAVLTERTKKKVWCKYGTSEMSSQPQVSLATKSYHVAGCCLPIVMFCHILLYLNVGNKCKHLNHLVPLKYAVHIFVWKMYLLCDLVSFLTWDTVALWMNWTQADQISPYKICLAAAAASGDYFPVREITQVQSRP